LKNTHEYQDEDSELRCALWAIILIDNTMFYCIQKWGYLCNPVYLVYCLYDRKLGREVATILDYYFTVEGGFQQVLLDILPGFMDPKFPRNAEGLKKFRFELNKQDKPYRGICELFAETNRGQQLRLAVHEMAVSPEKEGNPLFNLSRLYKSMDLCLLLHWLEVCVLHARTSSDGAEALVKEFGKIPKQGYREERMDNWTHKIAMNQIEKVQPMPDEFEQARVEHNKRLPSL
jgi:hypothetical protein